MSPTPPEQAHITSQQPQAPQPMLPLKQALPQRYTQTQSESQDEQTNLTLRGGERSGACPGRFCFCVPCPFPCDFCIF